MTHHAECVWIGRVLEQGREEARLTCACNAYVPATPAELRL